MISRPNDISLAVTACAPGFRPGWLGAWLLIVALSSTSGPTRAGDLEDCNGAAPEKIEPACTAAIYYASRPPDDRLTPHTNRPPLPTRRYQSDLPSTTLTSS